MGTVDDLQRSTRDEARLLHVDLSGWGPGLDLGRYRAHRPGQDDLGHHARGNRGVLGTRGIADRVPEDRFGLRRRSALDQKLIWRRGRSIMYRTLGLLLAMASLADLGSGSPLVAQAVDRSVTLMPPQGKTRVVDF